MINVQSEVNALAGIDINVIELNVVANTLTPAAQPEPGHHRENNRLLFFTVWKNRHRLTSWPGGSQIIQDN